MPDPSPASFAQDPWVRTTRYILWFCGATYVLLGLAIGPVLAVLPTLEDNPDAPPFVVSAILGLFATLVSVVVGAVNFVAASGLARGTKWGWILSVILGGIYAPSGCMLFGVLILYGLLNERVRKMYLG